MRGGPAGGHGGGQSGGPEGGHGRAPGAELLEGLTEPQKQAVLHGEGPLLIVAAAGSGKTRVITRRIAHLIANRVAPWSILALTFTNKAAAEMRERVHTLLENSPNAGAMRGLTITTFHALCARLLRRYAEAAGLKPDYTIYDTGDQSALVKKVIEAQQLSTSNFPPRSVLSAISNAKNDLLDAEQYAQQAYDFTSRNIAKIYAGYQKALRAANAVDFDDLLLLTARMLKKDASVRLELRNRWRYLLIDEYQDTNAAQFLIASLIAGTGIAGTGKEAAAGAAAEAEPDAAEPDAGDEFDVEPIAAPGAAAASGHAKGPNICVVGDPDQSIYGWRGADITNILDFEKHYPGARVIMLGENFRSTAPILAVADTLIRNNKQRRHKDLFTSKPGGHKVEATLCRDERHEAALLADWFRRLHDGEDGKEPVAWRDMAVFYRTNALSRVMEESLRQAGIPYTIARGTAFYEREEIKNALAYLRLVANPADDVSLGRIVNTPARGIGNTSMKRVELIAAETGRPILATMRDAGAINEIGPRGLGAVQKFVGLVDDWTGGGSFLGAKVSTSLAELVDRVIVESGLRAMYTAQAKAGKSETDAERVDNLDELVSSAREFELEFDVAGDPAFGGEDAATGAADTPPLLAMLRAYLESITLVADADAVDPAQGSVTLMTLHAAKGLEFHAVAMIGLEEGTLPHMRSRESDAALEEERRLCFVGITRAMRRLHITAANYRTVRGLTERTIPSRFLAELPQEHISASDQSDAYGDLAGTAWDDESQVDPSERPQRPSSSAAQYRSGSSASQRPAPGRPPTQLRPMSGGGGLSGGMGGNAEAKPGAFPVGSTVRHPQFGIGTIESITSGANARAVVAFREAGRKTLVLEYARLTRIK